MGRRLLDSGSDSGRGRRTAWLALGALAALLSLAYGNVVFGGRSLVYSNSFNPLDRRFTPRSYGPGFAPMSTWQDRNLVFTANFHDAGGPVWQWEADARFVRRTLLAGALPLWNPYVGAGAPEMANLLPTAAFPPYLAMVALGDTVGLRNAYQLLFTLAAGWLAFLFLRRHGLSPLACLTGGAAFMLCGAMAQNIGSEHGQTTACMPLALYLTRRFLDRPTARRAAGLALGFAAVSLSSLPPVLAACFGFAALYAVVAVLLAPAGPSEAGDPSDSGDRMPRGRLLARFFLAAALAAGLAGFYYLPAFALDAAAPQVRRAYEGAAETAVHPATLLQFVSPLLMGGTEILRESPMREHDLLHLPYAGWLPLLLAALALPPPRGRARPLWAAGWIALALLLLKLLGLPPVQWLAYLPGVSHLHVAHYFGDLFDLVVALLAALGVERLRRGGVTAAAAVAVGAGGLLLLLAIRRLAAADGAFARPWAFQWEREWWLLAGIAVVATGLVLAGVRRARAGKATRGVAAALLALFAVEAVAHTWYPRPRAFDVWRHPPEHVRALARRAGYGRVFTAGAFPADAGGAFGVFQLDSLLTWNAPRVLELYREYVDPSAATFLRKASRLPPEGVLDRAAIELLAISPESRALLAEAGRRPYALVEDDGAARLFRRRGSPHFYFSSELRVVAGGAAALAAIGRLPPGREVVLERPPSFAAAPNRPEDPAVAVAAFAPDGYRLRVDAPRPGLVYCADSLLPGWTARVDGAPAAILPANYAFRAVEVPAGRSEVELSYWPPGLTAGLLLTALSATVLGCLLAWPRPGR